MPPIEHVCDIVGRRLIRQGPPAATLDALWTRIKTAWRDIPHEDIQGLFDSMSRRIERLIRGFDPGRGRWIFSERKNPENDFLRKGSKAVGPVS